MYITHLTQLTGDFFEIIIKECEELVDLGHLIMLEDFNLDVNKVNRYVNRLLNNSLAMGLKQ